MRTSATAETLSRRGVLALVAGAAATAALGVSPRRPAAQGSDLLDGFMAASRYLTGRNELDPALGQRLLSALIRRDGGFPQALQAVTLRIQAGVPVERLVATLGAEGDPLRDAPVQMVAAWYLGEVGERRPPAAARQQRSAKEPAGAIEVVAYEKALMFAAVADVLTIPSYCRDAPGYWARNPGGAAT